MGRCYPHLSLEERRKNGMWRDAQRISWTCWLERALAGRLRDPGQLADSLNIGHTIWAQASHNDQGR